MAPSRIEADGPPFPFPPEIDSFVGRLVELVGGMDNLDLAVQKALDSGVAQLTDWGITNGRKFLEYASGLMKWTPSDDKTGNEIYYTICVFYFILDQPPINSYQTAISPTSIDDGLSSVSQWVVAYAVKMGAWMDTPESLTPETLESFYQSPSFNMQEAWVPPGGFRTFNQLFSRRLNDGARPIANPSDDRVITWPADSKFDGSWDIDEKSMVNIKQIDWPIKELLQGSRYAEEFAGGSWMHAFLGPTDYHRQHAPVSGQVLEARVIQGQAYLEVEVGEDENGRKALIPHRSWKTKKNTAKGGKGGYSSLEAPDTEGYQFLQTRGCVIIENGVVGKVAVLPIGMAYVSSVVLSVQDMYETGAVNTPSMVKKGDEISCFQFGGSDIVLVFQKGRGIDLSHLVKHQHYSVGMELARATP